MQYVTAIGIIGCGFVADLYMGSFRASGMDDPCLVFDHDPARLERFSAHWSLKNAATMEGFLEHLPNGALVLNLTNPAAHAAVSTSILEAGLHVYSEKPAALEFDEVEALVNLAKSRGLQFASAPCSVLGEAAQVLFKAVRDGVCGTPRLVYAELDDGFIPGAPYQDWVSASGAPWPFEDEFQTGSTLEHAGYYLSWLIACFGRVESVVAANEAVAQLPGEAAADFSCTILRFANGVTARLTCSIMASHDHSLRVFGDLGVLQVGEAWNNAASVTFKSRKRLRRRLIEGPVARRIRPPGKTHPKVKRTGAGSMNFALGPMEVVDAIGAGRTSRLGGDFALHQAEVTLAILKSARDGRRISLTSDVSEMEPMPWAR